LLDLDGDGFEIETMMTCALRVPGLWKFCTASKQSGYCGTAIYERYRWLARAEDNPQRRLKLS